MKTAVLLFLALLVLGCIAKQDGGDIMKVKSVFNNMDRVPVKYTCEGEDVSPPLEVLGIPEGAKSLAVIMDDPDAPVGTWVHWVVWNLPVENIEEGSSKGVKGKNSWGRLGYGGPCPPPGNGVHRYFFKVYALDAELGLGEGASKEELLKAMEGHILAKAELVGTYSREG